MKSILMRGAGSAPSHSAARLAWELRRLAHRLGAGGAGGACALLLAALAAMQSQSQVARQGKIASELALARSARPLPASAAPPDEVRQLEAFHAWLPAHQAIPELLGRLVEIAGQNGITLDTADYLPQPEDNAAFLRYQVTLPVKADYDKVQAFLVAALHALPTLTLDSVAFKRERIESGEVEARLRLNLLVRKAQPKGARR